MDKEYILNNLDIKTFYASQIPSIKFNSSMWGQGLCPFHEDNKPSFFANKETGNFHCKGCNKRGSIFDFYMERHSVDFPTACNALAKEAGLTTEPQKKIIKTYDYVDESGNLLFQTVRYEPKDFKQRRPDGKEGCIYNLNDVRLVLYNLPQVLKAEDVIIPEGEKDVETLRTIGLTATCNPMGAGKWRSEYNQYLEGKKVVIIPDNDKPGHDHALQIARSLKGIVESVRVIELQGLPDKGDVSDWIAQGHAKEEILELIKTSPEWEEIEEPKTFLSSLLKWNDILNLDIRTEYILQDLIPKGSITLLFGRGGIGKTSLSLQIAHAIAEGVNFGDLETIKTSGYFIDFENPLSVLKDRVEKIGQTDNLYVWHISNEIQPPKLDSKEWELYKQLPPGFIIFDTLRASHISDENDSKHMAIIISRLKELRESGFTVLLLHHTPKGNENIYKGSTAILDLADHVLGLEEIKEVDTVEFGIESIYKLSTRIKTRYEPHSTFLNFNPNKKGFEIARDPDTEKMKDIQELLRQSQKTPNQTEFRKMIKDELDYSDHEARRLIKKGEGLYWQREEKKEGKGHRAFCYVNLSEIYSADKSTQQTNGLAIPDTTNHKNHLETLNNSHLLSCQEGIQHNNTTKENELIDLEHEEVEIVE